MPSKRFNNNKYLTVDLETTRLDPITGEIAEWGFLLWILEKEGGKFNYKVLDKFHSLSRIQQEAMVDKKAMAVNKLSKEDLRKAPYPHEVRNALSEWLVESLEEGEVFLLFGHNVGCFDSTFLKKVFMHHYEGVFDYHAMDTFTVAKMAKDLGVLPEELSLNLADLARHLGHDRLEHASMSDCYNAMDVYIDILNML